MTMNERENDDISAVNTGCRPKVLQVPVKTEISPTLESFSGAEEQPIVCYTLESMSHQSKELDDDKHQMASKNPHDLDPKPAPVKAPVHHKAKHVRSFSDCTGISTTASGRYQQHHPLMQAATNILNNTQGSMDQIISVLFWNLKFNIVIFLIWFMYLGNVNSSSRPRFLDDGGSSIVVAAGGHEYPK